MRPDIRDDRMKESKLISEGEMILKHVRLDVKTWGVSCLSLDGVQTELGASILWA